MIAWAVDTLVWTGALLALVMLLRRPVARWFGPQLAYALWLLPLLRLAMPPLVLPARFAPVVDHPVPVAAGANIAMTIETVAAESRYMLPWALLLTSAWLGGAALFLLARWRGYRAMRARLLAGAVEVDRRDGVRLVETPAVDAPVAFGVRDKVIALPRRFLISGSLAERALAIDHELAHHRGGDLIANIAAQPLLALHWFNPLAWTAWRAMRRDQEAACDARALAGRDAATRAVYARVIASFAAPGRIGPRVALAAPMASVLGDKSIVHRLRSLAESEISPRRRRAGRWALAAGAALALPLTATVVYAGGHEEHGVAEPSAKAAPVKRERRVVVIRDDGDAAHHAGPSDEHREKLAFEKRIERDGKTIVVRSSHPIDEAELEARLERDEARLEADIERIERESARVEQEAAEFDEPAERTGERRSFHEIIDRDDDDDDDVGESHGARAIAIAGGKCGSDPTLADAEASADGHSGGPHEVYRTHVLLCGKAAKGQAAAIAHVRKARDRIAAKGDMPAGVRAEVLRQLDASIARLERE